MIANSTNRNYSENNTCTPATSKGDLIPKKLIKKKKEKKDKQPVLRIVFRT